MDPASAMLLFVLFQATEKMISYAGGKVADSVTKPIWDALGEKAKWLSGMDETSKRWEAFSKAFTEARVKLENEGRHPEVAKQVSSVMGKFTIIDPSDKEWLNDLSVQLEKASLVSEKPDEFLLVELFSHVFSKQNIQISRAELSETISDFVSIFQDRLFAQSVYREEVFKRAQWQTLRQPHYDTRERYISQIIDYNENLDFVGIPELKDRQALRIEDVFISLQTQVESPDRELMDEAILNRDALALIKASKQKSARRLSTNQALRESQKIVILGDPGAGKTTLLKFIVLAFSENKADKLGLQETRLPIFIRLYDYVAKREERGKEGFSFIDYLNKFCTDHLQLHLSPDFFEHALERGECCICFDGLDELGAAGLRREITSAVSAMANRYPRNRYVVASRIVGYEEAPLNKNEFTHHIVQPLSDEDIKSFVEKWYTAREKDLPIRRERTDHLIKTIMDEERIKSLASNPLMLTIIALVHRIEAELPHERVKLYDKCVTTLVETWDKVRGIKTTLRRRLLEKLAYWMHTQPGEKGRTREVREGTLRLQLFQFLQSDPKLQLDEDQMQKEVDDFITLVKTRSGLLIERGEHVYTFSHLTFQEFLAACDIEKRLAHSTDAIWNEIQPHLQDPHWRETILLLLGSLNRFEQHNSILVRRIYESSDLYEPVLHRYLFLTARILEDRVEVDVELRNQIADSLLSLARSDELARFDPVRYLAGLREDPRVVSGLLALMRDEEVDMDVRGEVPLVLGQLSRADEALLNELIAFAHNEKIDPWGRHAVAVALRYLGRAEEASQLFLAIVCDAGANVAARGYAVMHLSNLGRADEVRQLLLTLARDEKIDARLRREAAGALGQLGPVDEAILSELATFARDEKVEADVRGQVVFALGELGGTDEAALGKLLSLMRDENGNIRVRSEAARALGKLGQVEEAGEFLLTLLRDERADIRARGRAASGLGELGRANKAVLSELLVFAHNEKVEDTERGEAVKSLGQLGRADKAVLGHLLAFAHDEKIGDQIRRQVASALGKLGRAEEKVLSELFAIMRDEQADLWVRGEAAYALGQLGRAEQEVLSELLMFACDKKLVAQLD